MKITFVLPYAGLAGGIRVVAIYADRLQQRGHEVFVVSQPLPPPGLKQRLRQWLRGKTSTGQPSPSHFDGLAVPHKVLETCRPVDDGDVPDGDVVIATWWGTAEWVAALSPRKGAKVYFVQHHEIHPYFPVDRVRATYRLPLHKIVIAEWLKTVMAEEYGDSQVSIVPNSVDLDLFTAPPRSRQTLPTVGFMYSTKGWKGTDLAIQAWQLAQQTLPHLQGMAFGSEPVSTHLPLPAGISYRLKAPQNTLKEIYAGCDAWLFTSRVEGFGLPLLEAMACRTPVIATPAGAAPELLRQGGGTIVPAEDPESIAAAIVALCTQPLEQWQALSEAAYQTACRYTWDDATTLLETALLETALLETALETARQAALQAP
jgi:glycosyltransferase involved in cell wall biosynthesis